MSVSDELSVSEVEEHLKMFPFGRTREEIQDKFDQHDDATVDEVLTTMEDEGKILRTGSKFRWTG